MRHCWSKSRISLALATVLGAGCSAGGSSPSEPVATERGDRTPVEGLRGADAPEAGADAPEAGADAPEAGTDASEAARDVRIVGTWLAQTHVLPADAPGFKLVGGRPALLEVAAVSPSEDRAPPVQVTVRVGDESTTLPLDGPETLPASFPTEPGVVQHGDGRSFTVTIPADWVRPGLSLEVKAGGEMVRIAPAVGAPTVVHMTMFDVHYFGGGRGQDYPEGWQQELAAKWPVKDLEVQRVRDLVFDTLVIPPRPDVNVPAVRVSSKEEYQQKTGKPFDGEQGAALGWVAALSRAGGQGDLSLYYVNIYGVHAGGQAGGFRGVGNGTMAGVLHHELGHALSLPHWGPVAAYPYRGDMFGIAAPDTETHVGPVWAFDLPSGTFIPPVVQSGNVGGRAEGTFKADPMQGGGTGDQEPPFLLRHFSDYSVRQMRDYLEGKVVVYNAARASYASWDDAAKGYTKLRASNGVNYPIERNAEVISVMASTSMADPDANLVYPPIGPYRSGLIRTFDPRVQSDRTAAAQAYCPANGCDYSLRVVQGTKTHVLMLAASGDADDPLNAASLGTGAINLRASDGQVTRIDLLATPDAQTQGLPATEQQLYRWEQT